MAITVVEATKYYANGAAVAQPIPAALANGDVAVVVMGKQNDLGTPLATAMSGWTFLDEMASTTGNDVFTGAAYKVITDAAAELLLGTWDFTHAESRPTYGLSVVASGVDNDTPLDIADVVELGEINNNNGPVSAFTPVTDGALAIITFVTDPDLAYSAIAGPTGWTTPQTVDEANLKGGIAYKEIATAGEVASVPWLNVSAGTDNPILRTIVLRPGAGGGGSARAAQKRHAVAGMELRSG